MRIELREFLRDDGSSPYQEWFEGLDAQAAAKVATAEYRMSMGNTSNIKWFEGIGEYRIDWRPGYRIYLARNGEQLIVRSVRRRYEKTPAGRYRQCQGATRRIQAAQAPGEAGREVKWH